MMVSIDAYDMNGEIGKRKRTVEPIIIENVTYAPNHFVIPQHYEQYIETVLIPHGMIKDRIEKLARDIKDVYKDEELHLLCILKGSRGFFTMLLHYLNKIHTYVRYSLCEFEARNKYLWHTVFVNVTRYSRTSSEKPPYMEHYIRIKSYVNDHPNSEGKVEVISEDLSCLRGKNILIVEDIIDTGATLTKFCTWLQKIYPRHVSVTSLLEKRSPASCGFKGDFVGFSIPDAFVVGFSLDYNEMFRDLDHLCVLNEKGQRDFASSKL